jgi:hypothetical protein
MASEEYTARREEDREVLRQLEIRHLETLIAETPADKRAELKMIVGDRSFTLDQILAEAKEGTEVGLTFLDMQARSRLERLKRRG